MTFESHSEQPDHFRDVMPVTCPGPGGTAGRRGGDTELPGKRLESSESDMMIT